MKSAKVGLVIGSAFIALGVLRVGIAMGQTPFIQPRTLIHAVSIRWKPGVSDEEKEKVFEGVKQMAASIPGIQRVWIRSERVEPRGYDDGFAIEFRDRAAQENYASSPIHKAWSEHYLQLREASVSMDLTNP